MSKDPDVKVATNALRDYADILDSFTSNRSDQPLGGPANPYPAGGDSCAEQIRELAKTVDSGMIPVEAWGVPDGYISYGEGPSMPNYPHPELKTGTTPQHYVKFKNAYEAAHHAMVGRLRTLAEVYEGTAKAYRRTADHYDEIDDIEDIDTD